MDPVATGQENIFPHATVRGIKAKKVAPLVAETCEFSEFGNCIDVPVRTYSSGTGTRLVFAISTCISVDVIVMDEWLSVSDASAREKTQSRLRNLLGRTRKFVLA